MIMKTSMKMALASVIGQGRRLASVLVAIALGVAFMATTLLVSNSVQATLRERAAASVSGAAAVVSVPDSGEGPIPVALPSQVKSALPQAKVTAIAGGLTFHRTHTGGQPLQLKSLPVLDERTKLDSGRLPTTRGEIAVSSDVAAQRQIQIGQTVDFLSGEAAKDGNGGTTPLRVVGVVSPDKSGPDGVAPLAFALNGDIWELTGRTGFLQVQVNLPDVGMEDEKTKKLVAGLPAAAGLTVRTGAEEVAERQRLLDSGIKVVTTMLLGFVVIAVFVSALVISNTFSILIAQRTRALALMRCIGADRAQVRRAVLFEAFLVGVIGSVIGLLLGVAVAAIVVSFAKGINGLVPSVAAVLVPMSVGVVVTVLASLAPARAATRVAPIAALRPVSAQVEGRVARLRIVIGTALFFVGAVCLVMGARGSGIAIGVAGGVSSFLGVMLLTPLVVPAAASVVGAPLRSGGVAGRLAVANARRNPGRAAATASALLVGVTLVTMMLVGAATGTTSINASLDRTFPVDSQISAEAPLGQSHADKLAATPEVERSGLANSTSVTVKSGSVTISDSSLVGVSAEAAKVSRRADAFTGLADGKILLPSDAGIADGSPVTVATEGGRTLSLTAVVSSGKLESFYTTFNSVQRLDPKALNQVWVRYADGVEASTGERKAAEYLSGVLGVRIQGAAAAREAFQKIINIVLLVVVGLLAMAVVIALVGIGNTLGLSVFERTRESGLLRALGLPKSGLRAMFGLEALVLTGVGTALGLLLGISYGIAGSYALLNDLGGVTVDIPWARLLLVVAVALAAGWLASVLPAIRAAKVSASVALASE